MANEETVKFKPVVDKVKRFRPNTPKSMAWSPFMAKTASLMFDASIDIAEAIIKQVDQAK